MTQARPSPPEDAPARDPARWAWPGWSLRTRLQVAFATLTVVLAASILTGGSLIFSRKADALARDRLAFDVAAMEQVLLARRDVLRSIAQSMAHVLDPGLRDQLVCACLTSGQAVFDTVLTVRADEVSAFTRAGCLTVPLGPEASARVVASDLGDLARIAIREEQARAGFAVIPLESVPALGLQGDGLALASAAPLPGGGVLLLIGVLDGRNDLAREMADLIARSQEAPYRVSLFRDDVRVASSMGSEAIGTPADARVTATVLGQVVPYAGEADVVGRGMPAAYVPLRRADGSAAGMLGLSTEDDVYGAIRDRTLDLFVVVVILGLLVALPLSWLASAGLVRPIRALARGMTHVAQGDLDHKVRVRSDDELGHLARAFNRMVAAVKERDIRLQEMTAGKLSLVERQVSVGRLAAGVAHEINNPLTAILTLSMLLRRKMAPDDPRREDLDVVCEEAARCRDIVRSLLDFARERPTEMREVDVCDVVEETCAFVGRYGAFAGMDLVRVSAGAPMRVSGDRKQLQQVFTNLLLNAAEASAPGDTVRIRVEEDSSGGFVHVVIEDQGRGIAAEALGRIFEPFFTTKEGGKGTGLGLSVSLGIVQKHHGTIRVDSEEGRGTRATVVLPRIEDGTSGP